MSRPIDEIRQGCIYGGAIGDAFGYEVEFKQWPQILSLYGERGLVEPVLHDGKLIVSDDTQMTLFSLEAVKACNALTSNDEVVERIRQSYLDWYWTQSEKPVEQDYFGDIARYDVLQHLRAPGNCCMTSMGSGGVGTPENPINDNKGCGGVMRVAPIGLFPEKWNSSQAFEIGMRAAAITHTHPTGYLAAGAMAASIRYLFENNTLEEAILHADGLLTGYREHEETHAKIEQAIELSKSKIEPLEAVQAIGQGWIAEEAFGIGIYAALKGKSYQEVIRIGANHSGDSDSTASIAGQLYGAANGSSDIPTDWTEKLDVYPVIKKLLG